MSGLGLTNLSKEEMALLETFREIRETSRRASEWRTLAKLASAKARAEEQEYESRFMDSIPGQKELRIRLFNNEFIERLFQVRDRRSPPPEGVHRVRSSGSHHSLSGLAYELMIVGLEKMEQEYGISPK